MSTHLTPFIQLTTPLKSLKQIHTHLTINGLLNNPQVLGQFISTIALKNPINLDYAYQILEQCQNPTLFPLNSMIRVHSKSSNPQKSFEVYKKIQTFQNISPDNYTFTFLIRSCAQILVFESGGCVHCDMMKHGFENDPHVQSGLIYMYAELGCLHYFHSVFRDIHQPDLVCQTAMVSACAKTGDVNFARKLFDEMPTRDPIAWNAMISAYVQCGDSIGALRLFHLMQIENVRINEVSMVSVLSACAHLGALNQGKWVHAYIDRNKLRISMTLGTALIDMYAKCGNVGKAMEIFWGMKEKNVYTWTSAINGLAMNGDSEECLKLFSIMKQNGVEPNEVTFVSVLRGCSVGGLIAEGQNHFESMKKVYHIEPQVEHYGCMVDIYGRAGRLNDALSVINEMPIKPHDGAWGALLSACRIYKDTKLGEFAYTKLVELDAHNDNAYVLLSNIYAESKKWDTMTQTRQKMKAKGVKKLPGCSVMEVGDEVHEFFVGDRSHPKYTEIESMLNEISKRLKLAGYVANTNPVLFDIEAEEKRRCFKFA